MWFSGQFSSRGDEKRICGQRDAKTSNGLERVDVQFRTEFFNLFNIANMGLPGRRCHEFRVSYLDPISRDSRRKDTVLRRFCDRSPPPQHSGCQYGFASPSRIWVRP